MISKTIFTILFFISALIYAQNDLPKNADLLKSSANSACKCIDSIDYKKMDKLANNKSISSCIDKQVIVYQLAKKLSEVSENITEKKDKNVNIELNTNENSEEYKKSYYEIQEYLFNECKSVKKIIASIEYKSNLGNSTNQKAIDFYNLGIAAHGKENWKDALSLYEKAVKEDPNFAFAWDNIGLCNRKLGNLDQALEAYQKSLVINPESKMALQNIPVVYNYQKKYTQAIDAFKNLDKYYPNDPEVYYGIGQIYYEYLKEYEKSLDYMCKAYVIYTEQKSPYRTDAHTIIGYIYKQMKENGKTDRFNEILKQNKISPVE